MGNAEQYQIEVTMEECKAQIAIGEALERMLQSPDFQLVIRTGYFRDEPARLALLMADPSCESPDTQARIMRELHATGSLHTYLNGLKHKASIAARTLAEHQEYEAEQLRDDVEA